MGIIVQKYGGSSVADVEKLKRISEIIAAIKNTGKGIGTFENPQPDRRNNSDFLFAQPHRGIP